MREMAIDLSYPKWIIFRNGFQFGVTEDEAAAYVKAIAAGQSVVVIRGTALGNGLDQILTTKQRTEWLHLRKGDWVCRYGTWHSKKEADWQCMCGRTH